MHCQKCGADNREGARFCSECAAPLSAKCSRCSTDNAPGAKFCDSCGAALSAPVSSSPAVAATSPVQAAEATGERRHLTILFCDLVGSVSLTAQLDPEEWRAMVAAYQRTASEAITRFGGEVVRYVGDGIMAFFGYPAAHDNDAERAVRAGLAILDAIAQLNEQPAHTQLAVRIGIDSGRVVVGTGTGNAVDAFGDTANIAARVEAAAEPGTVMISDATQRLVSGLFIVVDRGAHTLKGIEQPIQLYRVIRPSGMRGRFEAATAAGGLTSFVGREEELELLLARWKRVCGGEGQVALIIGEAGIGKSRLLQQFHEQIAGTPHTWLESGASALFQNTPLYTVSEMLRQLLDGGTAGEQLAQLASWLTAAGLAPADSIPLLAPLLNLPLPPEHAPSGLSPEQQRRRLLVTLVEWMLGSARTQPLMIATEDLHWADPSTLELIQLLVEQGATAPLLLLYTARPEFRPSWPPRVHHTQVMLNRLNAGHVRTIVGEIAVRKTLSDETIATVVERTGGVPLFVEELTRALLESGNPKVTGGAIPATLHDSLMARLDRLGPAKEVIQVGAVIGSDFPYELLHAVYPISDADLQRALHSLTGAELLYVRGIAPEATYQFKHALIRDAAYEALLRSRRKELHLSVARAIDQQFPAIKDIHPEVLARHWTEAGEIDAAISAWQKAGEQACGRSSYAEAISNLTAGINLARSLPAGLDRIRRELPLQLRALPAIIATTGWGSSEVAETAARARELCRLLGDPPELFSAMYAMWSVSFIRAELRAALTMAQQLLQRAEASNDAALLESAYHTMGLTEYHLGDAVSAREHLRNAIANHHPQYSLNPFAIDIRVSDLSFQAWTLWGLGYLEQALRSADEAVAASEGLNPHSVVFADSYRSRLYQHKNNLDALEVSAQRQLRIASEYGLVDFAAAAIGQLGIVAVRRKNEEGIARIKEWVESFRRTGVKMVRPGLLCDLAAAYIQFGRFDQASEALNEAATIAAENEDRYCESETCRLQGELWLAKDRSSIEGARRCFERAIAIARAQSGKFWELRATTSLARLLAKQDHRDEARTTLAEIYSWFTEGFDTADLKDAKALLEELST